MSIPYAGEMQDGHYFLGPGQVCGRVFDDVAVVMMSSCRHVVMSSTIFNTVDKVEL